MSWTTRTDYCGLAVANAILVKSESLAKSGNYVEKVGQHGAIVASHLFGEAGTATNEYAVQAEHVFSSLKLGKIVAVGQKKYALQSVSIGKSAAAEPTLSATAQQVEDAASDTTSSHFTVPSFSLTPDECAAILFGAFTLTGSGCELVSCDAEVSCTVGTTQVAGVIVASDVHTGHIVVNATVLQTGETVPTVSPATGWELSSPLSSSSPDSDLPTWTFSLTKPLEKVCGHDGDGDA